MMNDGATCFGFVTSHYPHFSPIITILIGQRSLQLQRFVRRCSQPRFVFGAQYRWQHEVLADVAYGSKADMPAALVHVLFVTNSGHYVWAFHVRFGT